MRSEKTETLQLTEDLLLPGNRFFKAYLEDGHLEKIVLKLRTNFISDIVTFPTQRENRTLAKGENRILAELIKFLEAVQEYMDTKKIYEH